MTAPTGTRQTGDYKEMYSKAAALLWLPDPRLPISLCEARRITSK